MNRRTRVLIARLDNLGDVLLAGPAVRAVAGSADVTLLSGPNGRPAAGLLPGVDSVIEFRAPWIDPDHHRVDRTAIATLVDELRSRAFDQAIVLTSFHQSPLPLALLLRLADVPTIAAISTDFPGTLLDVRHSVPDELHEVERNLSLVAALGYRLPAHDDGRLAIDALDAFRRPIQGEYVVVHPGASVPARAWATAANRRAVAALVDAGYTVVVTGSRAERALTEAVSCTAGPQCPVLDLGGRTTFTELAEVLAGATAVVVGNTGIAHLAAAVGTPVVSVYAPTVPASRWHPWGVPHVVLGNQDIGCAGCRARVCPVVGQPCLAHVTPHDIVAAVAHLRHATAGGPNGTASELSGVRS
jgi:ADP-heptose:LPS heptosyltransferase